MTTTLELRVRPEVAYDAARLRSVAAESLDIAPREITQVRIVRRSIDARQRNVMVNLGVQIWVGEQPTELAYTPIRYGDVARAPQAVVVGAGPAGLFAALRLIELGVRPVVLERGCDVDGRKKDIAAIARTGTVNPESNYSFGEGGAGAFSDGKLYTLSKKRGNVARILGIFCQHGAATDILADAHPAAMRRQIIESGGEVHFRTRVDALLFSADGQRVEGVRTAGGDEWKGPVVLATGHSARDVYRYLHAAGVEIEQKGVAMGVRLEHPAHLIDQIQYHNREGRGRYIPAAEYAFVQKVNGRGVYSFCMCPGGYVVNASSEAGGTVVNGMSYADRGSANANAAIIVSVGPEDFLRYGEGVLAGLSYQEVLERRAYQAGQGHIPVQLYGDFIAKRESRAFGGTEPCFAGQYRLAALNGILDAPLEEAFLEGMASFGRQIKDFDAPDVILAGVESRTSSPIRILRDSELQANIQGFYPCGEGAGYAGGITSAAMDGIRVAEAVIARYTPKY